MAEGAVHLLRVGAAAGPWTCTETCGEEEEEEEEQQQRCFEPGSGDTQGSHGSLMPSSGLATVNLCKYEEK